MRDVVHENANLAGKACCCVLSFSFDNTKPGGVFCWKLDDSFRRFAALTIHPSPPAGHIVMDWHVDKVCDDDFECHHKRRLNKKIDFLSFLSFHSVHCSIIQHPIFLDAAAKELDLR